jgi:hypothetical protein
MVVGLAGLGVFVYFAIERIDEASRSIAEHTAPSIGALEKGALIVAGRAAVLGATVLSSRWHAPRCCHGMP